MIPQWIRFVSFLAFASIAITPFILRARKIGFGWLISLFWGAIAVYSIKLIQIPIQQAITEALVGTDFPIWIRMIFYLFPSGLVQEIAKAILPAVLIIAGIRLGTSKTLIGPAAGAGFGVAEAIWLVGLHTGNIGAVALVERLSAIIFHTGASAIAVGGGNARRISWGLPIAIIAHSLLNYMAVSLVDYGGIWNLEIIIGLFGIIVWIAAIIISKNKDEK